MMDLTPDGLVTLMAVGLSFVFAYFPMVKQWFDKVEPQYKPLLNAGILLLFTVGKLAVECSFNYECMLAGWQRAFLVWFYALIANQTAFQMGVKQFKRADQTDQPTYFDPYSGKRYN